MASHVNNVALDIDHLLTCLFTTTDQEAAFFLREGAILTAIKTHYIGPGIIEFIKFLFSQENILVSFFSNGREKRNVSFVRELISRALGTERCAEIIDKIKILSREQLVYGDIGRKRRHAKKYGLIYQDRSKDITKCLDPGEDPKHAVLLEDNEGNFFPGQEGNILLCSSTFTKSYSEYPRYARFTEGGKRVLNCVFVAQEKLEDDSLKKEIIDHQKIAIFQRGSSFSVGYINRRTEEYVERTLSEEENGELLSALASLAENVDLRLSRFKNIEKGSDLEALIYETVEQHEGKTTCLYHQANQVYYFTGLLFKIMELAEENRSSISEELFKLQFISNQDGTFRRNRGLLYDERIYELGLSNLQRFNQNLRFHSPLSFYQVVTTPVNQEESELIRSYRDNENEEECTIM